MDQFKVMHDAELVQTIDQRDYTSWEEALAAAQHEAWCAYDYARSQGEDDPVVTVDLYENDRFVEVEWTVPPAESR